MEGANSTEGERRGRDAWLQGFIARLNQLPPEAATEELMNALNLIVVLLDREELMRLRAQLLSQCPLSPEFLELIDGNLALREIQHTEQKPSGGTGLGGEEK